MSIDLASQVTHAMHSVRTAVHRGATAEEARSILRDRKLDHSLFYVYVIDETDRLLGQVSARRLLLCQGDELVSDMMHPSPALVSMHATVGMAFEKLATYRQLAVPIVDDEGKLLGAVDITAWAAEAAEHLDGSGNEIFGRLGAEIEEHRLGGPLRGFRLRMPWVLCNIASGLGCAFIVQRYDHLLKIMIALAGFIPMVLTVSESIGVQAAELSVQLLRSDPAMPAFRRRLRLELTTSVLLGVCTGAIVGVTSLLFSEPENRLPMMRTLMISVVSTILIAAMIGSFVPRIMRLLGADPKFASGPVTLMAVDVASTITYLATAAVIMSWYGLLH